MAQQLEEKVAVLSCSATEKEKRCQEERAVKLYLQEQIKSGEEELEKFKQESHRYQEHCHQLKDHLTAQEKKYLDLQNKLDDRGNAIRKLEEELHHSWEENEKLQTQAISAKTMLQETSNLNKAMKTELHVYERLHSSFLSSTADHKENRSPSQKSSSKINVEMLLDEFRNLRTQLELCIQTNCALRKQLEGQFNNIVEQVPTRESCRSSYKDNEQNTGSTEDVFNKSPTLMKQTCYSITKDNKPLSKSVMVVTDEENPLVKIPSVSTESGQFSDIESIHGNKDALNHCSHSAENVLEIPCNSTLRSSREHFHKTQKSEIQKIEKQRPSRLSLNRNSSNTKAQVEMPDIHSVYSSPDLGIESDPSPFSCLESKLNNITEEHLWDIHRNYKKGPKHELEINSNCHLLYAIGHLDDYDLLKKEVEDGIIIVRKLQTSFKERLHNNSTPKRHDDLTLKKMEKFVGSIDICLGKCSQIVGLFWMALLPSNKSVKAEELEKLMQENHSLKKKIRHQKRSLNEYLQKLNISNKTIEGMKKGITKQLLQTHDVLRKTKGNLQEQTKLIAKEE